MALRNLDCRKGNVVLEGTMILITLFVFSLMAIYGYQIFDDMNTDIQNSADMSNDSKTEMSTLWDRYPNVLDGLFALALGLIWLMTLIASFLIDSNPALFVVSVILLICLLIASGLLANAYSEFITDDSISTISSNFPIIEYVSSNLLLFVLVMGFSIAIVLYAKGRVVGG